MAAFPCDTFSQSGNDAINILWRPTMDQADRMIVESRSVYQRHLAAWASDCLAVRRAGLDEMSWRGDDARMDSLTLAA